MNDQAGFEFPSDLLYAFDRLLHVEMNKLDEHVQRGVQARIADANSRGMLQSGAALQSVADEAANSIPVRSQVAFSLLVRCIQSYGLQLSPAMRDAAAVVLKTNIQSQLIRINETVSQSAPFRSPIGISSGSIVLNGLTEKANNELMRIDAELDLLLAASQMAAESQDKRLQTMIFQGAVGVVQTGAGSSIGVVHQHIDAGASQRLENALAKVIEAIANAPRDLSFPSAEVQDMAIEAQDELKSANPNVTKLKALVTGIGNTIAYVPHIKEAYDTLKWAASLVGIPLP